MIAMVILAVPLLGLVGLQVVTVRGNSLATQITETTTLAQDRGLWQWNLRIFPM
jgi:Tfp pilus assembly protein PilV